MCQAVHAKPAMIALEDESGQNEPMQNWCERISQKYKAIRVGNQ
jgi:hypothetical protein